MNPLVGAAWSTQQLSEFLEVFEVLDHDRTTEVAIDRVAEAFDAEVVALLAEGVVQSCVGFPPDRVPESILSPLASARRSRAEMPTLGSMHSMSADVGGHPARLVVMRAGDDFSLEEEVLLRSMGRALGLALTAAEGLERERDLRAESDRRADENRRMAAELERKRLTGERMNGILRGITDRVPVPTILDAVVDGASELLEVDVLALRVLGPCSEDAMTVARGLAGPEAATLDSVPADEGFGGRAFVENRLVVAEHLGVGAGARIPELPDRLQVAMAVPVHRSGVPVGVLSAGSSSTGRVFSAGDCEVLEGFAQLVSVALGGEVMSLRLRSALSGATCEAQPDRLTGLLDRAGAVEALEAMLAAASESFPVSVLFLDIDDFKAVNDSRGRAAGDRVLMAVAERLRNAVRGDDVLARLSADEFLVASSMPPSDALGWGERLLGRIAEPLDLDGREVRLSAGVGVVSAEGQVDGEGLLADAHVALQRAKGRGRASVVQFDDGMRLDLMRRSRLEHELRVAVAGSQLVVHYQPMIDVLDGRIDGVEALVRWEHPSRGLLAPPEFLDVAEATGIIADIDNFVLFETCRQLGEWLEADPRLNASVNLSARQFADRNLYERVREALEANSVPSDRLWLEITESVVMDDTDSTAEIFGALKQLGVHFVIDDFGTGYSSMIYLKRFPVDVVKVDRSFVAGLGVSRDDEAIVSAILRLAEELGLEAVVEGIETEDQLRMLRMMGCRTGQGYLFSRPVPAEALTALLRGGVVGSFPF